MPVATSTIYPWGFDGPIYFPSFHRPISRGDPCTGSEVGRRTDKKTLSPGLPTLVTETPGKFRSGISSSSNISSRVLDVPVGVLPNIMSLIVVPILSIWAPRSSLIVSFTQSSKSASDTLPPSKP